jgi:hypothetical protein
MVMDGIYDLRITIYERRPSMGGAAQRSKGILKSTHLKERAP